MHSVVFVDPSFPSEGVLPEQLDESYGMKDVVICDAVALSDALQDAEVSCLVTLHGPYFPKSAWTALLSFLQRGGGLVHLGGAPFKIPVTGTPENWSQRGEETAYHQQLSIHEAIEASSQSVQTIVANVDLPLLADFAASFAIAPTYGLILTPAQQPDHPQQIGSASTMDTRIYPLLRGISGEGRHVTSPAVLIEHTRGQFAGGRWILISQAVDAAFWRHSGAQLVAACASYCSRGVTEMWIKPHYASYQPGEQASLTFQWEKIIPSACSTEAISADKDESLTATVKVLQDGLEIWRDIASFQTQAYLQLHTFVIPIGVTAGRYEVDCQVRSTTSEPRVVPSGKWAMYETRLHTGSPLTADRDYFRKDGKPFPVVGMTYMTSDVARKFLTLPNVEAWHRDMAEMKSAGINLIRTGIWTAWRNVMFEDGHASEEMLRAIDAFIMTAKAHDLEVTFTFFAFTPEAFEGANPYLDPRSVQAQKRFIAAIVTRHRETTNVHWDLINEPSLFDPRHPFSGPRSLGDPYERAAWVAWLKQRHPDLSELQHHWNMTPAELPNYESASLPVHSEINFDVEDLSVLKRGTRWLDYNLFHMDMHNQWAEELSSVIRATTPQRLITVGQDEALGMGPRPSPFFYAQAVDYTTVHSWWLNDHLVWDGVFNKTLHKPNLIQETGIMYLETPDNRAKRTDEELRNLLERKYAYAFATGGAGAVQWIWNTNYFMASVNESNIGALRADGSQKPEAQVSYDFGAFMRTAGHLFEDRELEEVAIVFPYSNDFSNRRVAFDATTKAVRVLSYDLKTPVRGLSEYHLADALTGPQRPKLVIVPSPHNFSDEALAQLLTYAETGGTLLWTGPLSLDAYWRRTNRMTSQFGPLAVVNVAREENIVFNGVSYPVSFSGRRIAELSKEVQLETKASAGGSGEVSLQKQRIGKGQLLWCALPLELSDQLDALVQLYRYALGEASVTEQLIWHQGQSFRGLYGRKLQFSAGALYVFVSEHAGTAAVEVEDTETGRRYCFDASDQRSVLFAVNRSGDIIASYRKVAVTVSDKAEAAQMVM